MHGPVQTPPLVDPMQNLVLENGNKANSIENLEPVPSIAFWSSGLGPHIVHIKLQPLGFKDMSRSQCVSVDIRLGMRVE